MRPFPSLNSWRTAKYLVKTALHVRFFVYVIEHSDEQTDETVEGYVKLLSFFDFFIRLDGYTRL